MKLINGKSIGERAEWLAIGAGLKGLSRLLMYLAGKDPWIGRAVKEFDGVYRFENAVGNHSRYMVFSNGKVKAPGKWKDEADFTFTLYESISYYRRAKAEDLLEMAIANKIGQTGNSHYLFQFGFVMSLVERYFKRKMNRTKMTRKGAARI